VYPSRHRFLDSKSTAAMCPDKSPAFPRADEVLRRQGWSVPSAHKAAPMKLDARSLIRHVSWLSFSTALIRKTP
jgi:hypothetical protein